jgi:hypothetical protein
MMYVSELTVCVWNVRLQTDTHTHTHTLNEWNMKINKETNPGQKMKLKQGATELSKR